MSNTNVVRGNLSVSENLTITGVSTIPGVPTCTVAALQVYADGTSGNDSLSGLSLPNAKKTLQAVFDLIPEMKHNVAVNLSGVFDEYGDVALSKKLDAGVNLVVDGSTATTTFVAEITSDINSISTIGFAAAGWVIDAYAGYAVKVTSGVATNDVRLIQSNTATALTVTPNFSVDPGSGAKFEIVRPTTTLSSSSLASSLNIKGCSGNGTITVQNLYFSGTKSALVFKENDITGACNVSNVISLSSTTYPVAVYKQSSSFVTGIGISASAFTPVVTNVYGISSLGVGKVVLQSVLGISLGLSYLKNLICDSCTIGNPTNGLGSLRADSIVLANTCSGTEATDATSSQMVDISGQRPTFINNLSGVGLKLINSQLKITTGDINSCSSHAIELVRSFLEMDGVMRGVSNTGAGVYAHSGSSVQIKNGSTPTITGTVGNCSTDGSTQATTWAAVDSGTPYTDVTNLVNVKEV
jgi:hypothetical protein